MDSEEQFSVLPSIYSERTPETSLDYEVVEMKDNVLERLMKVEERVRSLEEEADALLLEKGIGIPEEDFTTSLSSSDYMFRLPETLRKTMSTMEKLGKATSSMVTNHTRRSRDIEYSNLNELERMGYLCRVMEGERIYFKLLAQPLDERSNTPRTEESQF
jgi:hypothetical protein